MWSLPFSSRLRPVSKGSKIAGPQWRIAGTELSSRLAGHRDQARRDRKTVRCSPRFRTEAARTTRWKKAARQFEPYRTLCRRHRPPRIIAGQHRSMEIQRAEIENVSARLEISGF